MRRLTSILEEAAATKGADEVWISEIDTCTVELAGYHVTVNATPRAELRSPHPIITAIARRCGVRAEVKP